MSAKPNPRTTRPKEKIAKEKVVKEEKTEKPDIDKSSIAYIKEQTKGYAYIKPEHYGEINIGDKIKYILRTDPKRELKSGGFIWANKKGVKEKYFFIFSPFKEINFNDSSIPHFMLYWENILHLWKKMSVDSTLLRQSIDVKQENISDIYEFLKKKFGNEFEEFCRKRLEERQNR